MQHLMFTLAAPLASFGTVAVGERRPTWDRPSKSQTIGLIAGALGIERSDVARQEPLTAGLGFAVRVDNTGQLLADYHTTQAAPQPWLRKRAKADHPVRTRAQELDCNDLKTILSRREYRVDSLHTICLWTRGDHGPTLGDIASALRTPAFTPFAGRKSNALMLPMRPVVIEAKTLEAAFANFGAQLPPEVECYVAMLRQHAAIQPVIFSDADGVQRGDVSRIDERRDIPENRAKWRFGLRTEVLLRTAPAKGNTP